MTISLAEKRKKRFADFATEPPPLEGEKVKLDGRSSDAASAKPGTLKTKAAGI